jgi:hypothetical protein
VTDEIPKAFSQDERRWVQMKWGQIRTAQRLADVASNKWKRVNDEINDYLDRKGEFDIVQRAKVKSESLALKDALATGNWHSRNAERHIHDVDLFLKLKGVGLL